MVIDGTDGTFQGERFMMSLLYYQLSTQLQIRYHDGRRNGVSIILHFASHVLFFPHKFHTVDSTCKEFTPKKTRLFFSRCHFSSARCHIGKLIAAETFLLYPRDHVKNKKHMRDAGCGRTGPFYKRIFIYAKLRKSYVTNINLYLYHIYI